MALLVLFRPDPVQELDRFFVQYENEGDICAYSSETRDSAFVESETKICWKKIDNKKSYENKFENRRQFRNCVFVKDTSPSSRISIQTISDLKYYFFESKILYFAFTG